MKILLHWLLSALALLAVAYLIPGIEVASFYTALIAALVIGLVNAILRPILLVLTIPINVLTLGLFTLVLNAFLFWLASTIVKGFTVTGFGAAFLGALLFWLISWAGATVFRTK